MSSLSTHITMAFFQSLEAFWPGMLAGIGDIDPAYRSLMHYVNIWRHYGFTPEFFDVVKARVVRGREGYPLRPGLVNTVPPASFVYTSDTISMYSDFHCLLYGSSRMLPQSTGRVY